MTGAPSIQIEKITPKLAASWLGLNRSNRPLRSETVTHYTEAMRRGEWMMNGETIKFDSNGALLDGQHRLAAIVRFDKPIESVVVRALDPECFKTIDQGKARNGADMVALRGYRYGTVVAAAYRHLHRYVRTGPDRKRRLSNAQLVALMDEHPGILERSQEILRAPLFNQLVTASMLLFCYYCATRIHEGRAYDFFEQLAGDPVPGAALQLKQRLEAVVREEVPPSQQVRMAWMIVAWNHWLDGRKVLERFSRAVDELPRFDPEPPFARSKSR